MYKLFIIHYAYNRNALHLLDQDSDTDDSLDFEKSATENKDEKTTIARKKGAYTQSTC
jgi:hypothetical protein